MHVVNTLLFTTLASHALRASLLHLPAHAKTDVSCQRGMHARARRLGRVCTWATFQLKYSALAQATIVLLEYKWPATAAAAAWPLGRTHWHCPTMLSSCGTVFVLLVCLLAPCQSDAARCANPFVCSEEDREESIAGSGQGGLWEEGTVPYVFESSLRECIG